MEQQHVFHGFKIGDKTQTSLLADQIVNVNSKLLQHALKNIGTPSKRLNITELTSATSTLMRNTMKISKHCLTASEEKAATHFSLQEKGCRLISEGKLAMVLVLKNSAKHRIDHDVDSISSKNIENNYSAILQMLVCDNLEMVDCKSVPLVLICPAYETQTLENLLLSNDYFGLDSKKVWLFEEEKLPIVSYSLDEQKRNKILMKSPWEILQTPVGSGGVISLLSSHKIMENLKKLGVEYIEIFSVNEQVIDWNPVLLGFVNSCGTDIGVQISEDTKNDEEHFNMIFTMNLMNKLTKEINKLEVEAILTSNSHVEKVDKEWIHVMPSSPNSLEFRSSIYSCLSACDPNKVCVMEIE